METARCATCGETVERGRMAYHEGALVCCRCLRDVLRERRREREEGGG